MLVSSVIRKLLPDPPIRAPKGYTTVIVEKFQELDYDTWSPTPKRNKDPRGSSDTEYNGEYQFNIDPRYPWPGGFSPFHAGQNGLTITARETSQIRMPADIVPIDPRSGKPFSFLSGYLESSSRYLLQGGFLSVRARIPRGRSMWPAIWLLSESGNSPPEIDVMEYVGGEGFRSNVHLERSENHSFAFAADRNLHEEFHDYGVRWDDTTVEFWFDGEIYHTVDISENDEFQRPFYVILNLAVGSEMPDWVPRPDSDTPGVARFQIKELLLAQHDGPNSLSISNWTVSENAEVGTPIGSFSSSVARGTGRFRYSISADPDQKFAIAGNVLSTAAHLNFADKQVHVVTVTVSDDLDRTWQRKFRILVIDSDARPNLLLGGSLSSSEWRKFGTVVAAVDSSESHLDLVSETDAFGPHAIMQSVLGLSGPKEYLLRGDFRSSGREWLRFEVSTTEYEFPIGIFFDLRNGAISQPHSEQSDQIRLQSFSCQVLADGFVRCIILFWVSPALSTLRVQLKLVSTGSEYDPRTGKKGMGVFSRGAVRLVEIANTRAPDHTMSPS
jgi:beta-glucanase (GH16 family)